MSSHHTTLLTGLLLAMCGTTLHAGTAMTTASDHSQFKTLPPVVGMDRSKPDYQKLKALFKGQQSHSERRKIEAVNRFYNKM